MTALEKRHAVIAQAREWLGLNEADGGYREIIDLYNRLRPPDSYRMTYDDPWCAAFVSAVGMASGLGDILLPHVSCDGLIEAYRARGRWVEDDAYLPAPGDLIFYDWQDSGPGDNRGSSDHVGIVVDSDGRSLTVIEGNKGVEHVVAYRTVPRGGPCIRGFAVPDYAAAASPALFAAVPDPAGADVPACHPERSAAESKDPSPALFTALPVLSLGCRGRPVVAAQGILIALGCSCGPDGADGDFGPNTERAVRRFRLTAGLSETSEIDAAAWAKLLGV